METLIQQKIAVKRSTVKLLLLFSCFFYHPFLYAQQDKTGLNIVFIGNSITQGAGLKDSKTMAPPVLPLVFCRNNNSLAK